VEFECNLGGMNDVIAPKRSSLKSRLVEATMFLKLNMSLIPYNPTDVAESPIWNTLIPSHLELLDDIDDSNDNENQEDDDNDNDDEDDDLSPMLVKNEEAN
jgi:hypothetical protein